MMVMLAMVAGGTLASGASMVLGAFLMKSSEEWKYSKMYEIADINKKTDAIRQATHRMKVPTDEKQIQTKIQKDDKQVQTECFEEEDSNSLADSLSSFEYLPDDCGSSLSSNLSSEEIKTFCENLEESELKDLLVELDTDPPFTDEELTAPLSTAVEELKSWISQPDFHRTRWDAVSVIETLEDPNLPCRHKLKCYNTFLQNCLITHHMQRGLNLDDYLVRKKSVTL
jgi:hypothetical protein